MKLKVELISVVKSDIMEHWPNFFIVGVEKSGSSSFWIHLSNTKGIYMSKVKAPGFFHGKGHNRLIDRQIDYLELFKAAKNKKAIGEATVSYFTNPETANLIKKRHSRC